MNEGEARGGEEAAEEARREKERADILHNILRGGVVSEEKRREAAFPDIRPC